MKEHIAYLVGWYRQPTYHFHGIARVLSNPSRHYGEVQWVFSPPVHCLPYHEILMEGCAKGLSMFSGGHECVL